MLFFIYYIYIYIYKNIYIGIPYTDIIMSSWNKVNYLIDIQGFYRKKEFIFKEVATLDLEYGDINYYLIKPSVSYKDLDKDTQQNVNYLYNYVHGIDYSSGFMCEEYALQLIRSELQE